MTTSQPVVVTSISPSLSRGSPSTSDKGLAYQSRCVQSWLQAGAHVVSVNNRAEMALLDGEHEGVEFVPSAARRDEANPKGLPSVSEMLQVGCDLGRGRVFALANSDVEFRGDAPVLQALFEAGTGGCAFANRHEWAPHAAEPGLPYLYGYDFFVVDNALVCPVELEGFRIGAPWWDYLFLYLLAARETPLTLIDSAVIAHSTHDQAWSVEGWTRGLERVARRVRQLCEEEGPAAALLAYMLRSLEAGVMPSFAMDKIAQGLGTVLGTAMVSMIASSCRRTLWFESVEVEGGLAPRGPARTVHPCDHLGYMGL